MPRRFTIDSKINFARYMISHDFIQAFTLDMPEYEELCCLLNLKPRAFRHQKCVNVINLNLLLSQFRLNSEEWLRLIDGTKRISEDSKREACTIIDTVEEDNCKCEQCTRSAAWNGIRRYKFSDYNFHQLQFSVEISSEKWRELKTIDKKENLKLRPGNLYFPMNFAYALKLELISIIIAPTFFEYHGTYRIINLKFQNKNKLYFIKILN